MIRLTFTFLVSDHMQAIAFQIRIISNKWDNNNKWDDN